MEVWNWAAPMGHLVIFLTLQTGKKTCKDKLTGRIGGRPFLRSIPLS